MVDLGVLGRLRDLGEPAAEPQALDVVHRGGLEAERAEERDLASIDLDRRRLEILPARALPVLPLEQAREVAGTALRRPEVDPEERRIAGVREPRVREVEVALDALRAGEDLERRVGGAGGRVEVTAVLGVRLVEVREAAVGARLRDDGVARGLERDDMLLGRLRRGDLGAAGHALLLRAIDEREPDQRARRARRPQLDTEQVEERDVVLVGDLVESVDEQVGHPRRQLDERDPRVGRIVVRPLRRVARDHRDGFLDNVVEGAVVELRRWDHGDLVERGRQALVAPVDGVPVSSSLRR